MCVNKLEPASEKNSSGIPRMSVINGRRAGASCGRSSSNCVRSSSCMAWEKFNSCRKKGVNIYLTSETSRESSLPTPVMRAGGNVNNDVGLKERERRRRQICTLTYLHTLCKNTLDAAAAAARMESSSCKMLFSLFPPRTKFTTLLGGCRLRRGQLRDDFREETRG